MHPRIILVALACILFLDRTAEAQFSESRNPHSSNGFELGVSIGAWNLNDGGSLWAARFSHRRTHWLSSEVTFDGGRPDSLSPSYRMATFAVKLSAPGSNQPGDQSLFVTLGAAAASGLSYRTSLVAGVGWQSAWVATPLAARVELQLFSQGSGLHDKGRLLCGFVVRLP